MMMMNSTRNTMTDIQHTQGCIEQGIRRAIEITAWKEKWPSHCKSCGGWGGIGSTFDPSPAGVSLSPGVMYDWDPCEQCSNEGICGRCGEATDTFGDAPCQHCGWNWGQGDQDGCPPEHKCYCWENELDDWYKNLIGPQMFENAPLAHDGPFPPLPWDPHREDWETDEFNRTHGGMRELLEAEARNLDIYDPRTDEIDDDDGYDPYNKDRFAPEDQQFIIAPPDDEDPGDPFPYE